MMRRLVTLFRKEVLDLMRNRAALAPVVIAAGFALLMPFSITLLVPALSHQSLGADTELSSLSRVVDGRTGLGDNALVQLFLFQQFLLVFLMMPITGARRDLTGSFAKVESFCPVERDDARSENQRTILSE